MVRETKNNNKICKNKGRKKRSEVSTGEENKRVKLVDAGEGRMRGVTRIKIKKRRKDSIQNQERKDERQRTRWMKGVVKKTKKTRQNRPNRGRQEGKKCMEAKREKTKYSKKRQ